MNNSIEYQYRFAFSTGVETVWCDSEITADELIEWRKDFPNVEVHVERRAVLYSEPKRYEPTS